MTDPILDSLALLEIIHRLGSTDDLAAYHCLAGDSCPHSVMALFLAGLCVDISDEVAYPLTQKVARLRADALQPDEPGIA